MALAEDDGSGCPADGDRSGHPAEDDGSGHPAEDDGSGHPADGDGSGHPADGDGSGHPADGVTWVDLPESARTAAIGVAARALTSVPPDQLPSALAPVARFTPAKRARRGAVPLARALERDAAFRALVAQHLPVAGSGSGTDPGVGEEPVAAAVRLFLLRQPDTAGVLDAVARADEVQLLRSQVAELTGTVDRLTARLADSASRRAAGGDDDPAAVHRAELDRLRQRLRDQGSRVKDAERAAQEAVAEAERQRDEAVARAEREQATAETWRQRAEQHAHRADLARQALQRAQTEAGRERADADRRIELLLETVQRAADGLRREWRLATGGADPADVVARRLPEVDATRRRSVDSVLLLEWLGLPGAHLIVDGYNVTKTGFPELSLADQRDRLVRALSALAARTGAATTVVFDGAAVVAAAPSMRGVRVMFSPPGVIADEVIRDLAAAEPAGRVVVVVSSDREVVDGVRRSGARTAPSPVLLAALA